MSHGRLPFLAMLLLAVLFSGLACPEEKQEPFIVADDLVGVQSGDVDFVFTVQDGDNASVQLRLAITQVQNPPNLMFLNAGDYTATSSLASVPTGVEQTITWHTVAMGLAPTEEFYYFYIIPTDGTNDGRARIFAITLDNSLDTPTIFINPAVDTEVSVDFDISYALRDRGNDLADIEAEFRTHPDTAGFPSVDSPDWEAWEPATFGDPGDMQATGSATGQVATFEWNILTDIPFTERPKYAQVRLRATEAAGNQIVGPWDQSDVYHIVVGAFNPVVSLADIEQVAEVLISPVELAVRVQAQPLPDPLNPGSEYQPQCSLTVEYRTSADGTSYSPPRGATPIDPGMTSGLTSSLIGIVHTYAWDATSDLPEGAQFVILRLQVAYEYQGRQYFSTVVETPAFILADPRNAPSISIDPVGAMSSGYLEVDYRLFDPNSDFCNIEAQYRTYSSEGAPQIDWTPCTERTGYGDGMTFLNSAERITNAMDPNYPGGVTHTFVWNTPTDLPQGAGKVQMRLRPYDLGDLGAWTLSLSDTGGQTFTLDNQAFIPTVVPVGLTGGQSGLVPVPYAIEDQDASICSLEAQFSVGVGDPPVWSVWQPCTDGNGGDGRANLSSSPTGTGHLYLWNSSADIVDPLTGEVIDTEHVSLRLRATDAFNTGAWAEISDFPVSNTNVPVVFLPTLTQTQSGRVGVRYTLQQNLPIEETTHLCEVTTEYATSPDGANWSSWELCTPWEDVNFAASHSWDWTGHTPPSLGSPVPPNYGWGGYRAADDPLALPSSRSGEEHVFVWDSAVDLPTSAAVEVAPGVYDYDASRALFVKMRFRAEDREAVGTVVGGYSETNAFRLYNPPRAGGFLLNGGFLQNVLWLDNGPEPETYVLTVECWAYFLNAYKDCVILAADAGPLGFGNELKDRSFALAMTDTGHLEFRLVQAEEEEDLLGSASYSSNGEVTDVVGFTTDYIPLVSEQTVPLNQWVHLAAVFNVAQVELYIYAEDTGIGTTAVNWPPPVVSPFPSGAIPPVAPIWGADNGPFTIGNYSWAYTPSRSVFGYVDDVRVWATPRTAEQIADGRHGAVYDSEYGLLGHYRFQDSGQLVGDTLGGAAGQFGFDPGPDLADPTFEDSPEEGRTGN